jgi:NAD(P)-dependent dehydrogenase (short-subunit alcohol dehydrogenase family)
MSVLPIDDGGRMSQPVAANLAGTAVLVTGGTKGLGRGLATAFLSAGADVMVCARGEPEAPVEADGRVAGFVAADLRDPAAASAAVAAVVEQFGRLDVCINNAGGSPRAEAASVSPRFFEKVVALNLLAPFYVAQAANAVMQHQSLGGVILNIGSISGERPSPGTAAYAAAKAGLASLTCTLAMEWGPRVRVNAVTVGYLETEQTEEQYGEYDGMAGIADLLPMRRFARPADVAAACLFLASPGAVYLTGANLLVHGGGEPPPFFTVRRGGPGSH